MSSAIKSFIQNLYCRWRIIIFILLIINFLEIIILVYPQFISSTYILQQYANTILTKCSSARYHPACYDEEIPKLMDTISMEEAFEVTKLVQQKDSTYSYCHVLGHNLSAKETAKDSSHWTDIIGRCPSGLCSNGCIHGAFQERFREEVLPDDKVKELIPVLEGACRERLGWEPTPMEQATCTHALGHLTMYITGADIRKSIELCEEVALRENGRDFSQMCFDGAFMQIFQPLEPEDFALVEGKQPTKEELRSFCWSFTGKKRGTCWVEGWPLFIEEVTNPDGLITFCSVLNESTGKNRCFDALSYILTVQFQFDEMRITNFCSNLPIERRGQCFASAASRMIETDWRNIDKSVHLCSIAETHGVGNECYEKLLLLSTYNFKLGSEEFFNLCSRLPDYWNQTCLNQYSNPSS